MGGRCRLHVVAVWPVLAVFIIRIWIKGRGRDWGGRGALCKIKAPLLSKELWKDAWHSPATGAVRQSWAALQLLFEHSVPGARCPQGWPFHHSHLSFSISYLLSCSELSINSNYRPRFHLGIEVEADAFYSDPYYGASGLIPPATASTMLFLGDPFGW